MMGSLLTEEVRVTSQLSQLPITLMKNGSHTSPKVGANSTHHS